MADRLIPIKYPILLVHGAGFRDTVLGFSYWGRIPTYLQKSGIVVYFGGTDAWGSIESNAEILKKSILTILKDRNVEKVNIIAHSRGGLESRYLIHALHQADVIASLTTIATPHRGVKALNIATLFPVWLYKSVSFFIDIWCRIMGDKNPDFFTSSRELSEKYCSEFNKKYPDKEHIYYQSYVSILKYFFGDMLFMCTFLFIALTDGDNDGLCPVESAKWGHFKGTVTPKGIFGISHAGIIDLYRIRYKGIDIPELYVNIVKVLSEKGF
ncbi:putative triacylglycerol lipase [Pillotina sp. SPG140]|jgi:triacylglycerol lipase